MKRIKFYYITVLFLIFISCENELEIEPAQSVSFEAALSSEENILNILNGAYNEAGQNTTFGGRSQIIADLLGSTNEVVWTGTFLEPRQIFTKSIQVSNSFVANNWANSYEVINQTNLVIDHLDLVTSSLDTKNSVEGQAKFLRALSYFDLIRLFALPYESGQTNSQLGVPLRLIGITDFGVDLSMARNTVEEVYGQIISDLNDAYNLLPETNSFFADKYSAQALLAKVYMQQGNYVAARDAANNVIEFSGHSITNTFAEAFNNDNDSDEDLFDFQVTDQDGSNDLIIFYASQENGGRQGDISIASPYLNLFDDPTNDVRASFLYVSPDNGLDLTSKYTNQFGNVPIIRLADIHLIRAEANFREGTSVGMDPLTEVNNVRARSNANPLGVLTLDIILNERKLELGFEGHLIHDLKRFHKFVGSLPYNDNTLVLPIPQDEMDTNSLIVQNPGYGG
jgi:tetratricopeptide (TPR) repeat protein